MERIDLLIQEVLPFPWKTSLIARHELVGLGQASASASRAPRPQWAPSAVGEPFGNTSDAISRQPLRVGRVDRCWCQWHGWGASWQRDKPRRAPRHTGTLVPFIYCETEVVLQQSRHEPLAAFWWLSICRTAHTTVTHTGASRAWSRGSAAHTGAFCGSAAHIGASRAWRRGSAAHAGASRGLAAHTGRSLGSAAHSVASHRHLPHLPWLATACCGLPQLAQLAAASCGQHGDRSCG